MLWSIGRVGYGALTLKLGAGMKHLGRNLCDCSSITRNKNEFVSTEHGLPRRDAEMQLLKDPPRPADAVSALAETRHKGDFGFCDSMAYDGHRYIYAGTVAGMLARIDTITGEV
jgi:hypothetical protein